MKAGDLRHQIALQRPVISVDAKGNRRTAWQDAAVVWASMADVSGKDFYQAQAYQAQDTVTFGIRWRGDVDLSWRVLLDGRAYKIVQINHLGYRGDYMHLKARQVAGKEA